MDSQQTGEDLATAFAHYADAVLMALPNQGLGVVLSVMLGRRTRIGEQGLGA